MVDWRWLIVAFIFGGNLGAILMSAIIAASEADERAGIRDA